MHVFQYGDIVTNILPSSVPQLNRRIFLREVDSESSLEVTCVSVAVKVKRQ